MIGCKFDPSRWQHHTHHTCVGRLSTSCSRENFCGKIECATPTVRLHVWKRGVCRFATLCRKRRNLARKTYVPHAFTILPLSSAADESKAAGGRCGQPKMLNELRLVGASIRIAGFVAATAWFSPVRRFGRADREFKCHRNTSSLENRKRRGNRGNSCVKERHFRRLQHFPKMTLGLRRKSGPGERGTARAVADLFRQSMIGDN